MPDGTNVDGRLTRDLEKKNSRKQLTVRIEPGDNFDWLDWNKLLVMMFTSLIGVCTHYFG